MSGNPTWLVVGASGYIGRSIFTATTRYGCGLGTSSSGSGNLLPLRLDAPAEFDYAAIQRGDVAVIAAAISSPDLCASQFDRAWDVNVTGSSYFIQRVLDRGARVLFLSSDTVYGERENEFDETGPCDPAGDYAQMKRAVEQRFVGEALFKAIRLSHVFSHKDKVTHYLTRCAARGEEAEIFHPFLRAIVHLDDVVDGIFALSASWDDVPAHVLNFGGPQIVSRVELAECIRESHLRDLRFTVTEPHPGFFRNRPRVIAMKSPLFAKLLGRPPRTLREAAHLEFRVDRARGGVS